MVAAIFVRGTVSLDFKTCEMLEPAALVVSLVKVLLVSELVCAGNIFIPAKKSPATFLPKMGYLCFQRYSHRRQGFYQLLAIKDT